MDNNTIYTVTNRSASMVVYSIPEDNVRREFAPGETKNIRHSELQKLSWQEGGSLLINNYFLIKNKEALQELNVHVEPEYNLTETEIITLIKEGSLDEWLDCLDFAPAGVMELIKDLSIKVPLGDYNKRQALLKKTGFDVDAALKHIAAIKEDEAVETAEAPKRRVQKAETAPAGRRTTPKYNIVNKEDK